jgi:hypothetical protein
MIDIPVCRKISLKTLVTGAFLRERVTFWVYPFEKTCKPKASRKIAVNFILNSVWAIHLLGTCADT